MEISAQAIFSSVAEEKSYFFLCLELTCHRLKNFGVHLVTTEIEGIFNVLLGSLVVCSLQKNTGQRVKHQTSLMYRRYKSLLFNETETFCIKVGLCISSPNEDHGDIIHYSVLYYPH